MTNPAPPLKLIGYWLDRLSDDDFLAPQEVMFQLPSELRERVAAYLDGGALVRQYRGASRCRFYCGQKHNGCCERSDGEWVWPDGLAHYVREHGIRLPEPFIEKVLESKPVDPDAHFEGEISHEYWKSWCRANQNPEFRRQLAEERRIADALKAAEVEASAAQKALEMGVSENECAAARCNARALVESAFCAKHWLEVGGQLAAIGLGHYRARSFLTRWSAREAKQIDTTSSDIS